MNPFASIPKDPPSAFRYVLTDIQNKVGAMGPNQKFAVPEKTDLLTLIRILEKIVRRLPNSEDYKGPLLLVNKAVRGDSVELLRSHLDIFENLFLAEMFDDHFLDQDDEETYNTVNWQDSDRSEVLETLNEARQFVLHSGAFEDEHKNRIKYWIDNAESEVFKTEGKLANILGAVGQIAETAGIVGTKAQPLGELVKSIRSTTKRNVHIHQIEAPEEQKKLPKPDDSG